MKTHTIAVLEGDGIGPEIVREAVKVLRAVEPATGARFELKYAPFGGQAWFDHGSSFPAETMAVCDASDAILKGPIGLSFEESKKIPVDEQPERGALLPLRRRYNTFANFRPVYLPPELQALMAREAGSPTLGAATAIGGAAAAAVLLQEEEEKRLAAEAAAGKITAE